ncbi:MAG TPA: biotin--[acetyl-CoA-carboxylase] ligase [Pyrinomonadaceae bacterium]|nr:biotin--[acetyl-CoA-carboxylase] ligase [Pyrinomonadaceae bacterium]
MKPFSPVVLRFDSLPSTNTEAVRQAIAGAREGLCVVAKEQTAGRGRFERSWVSPKDAGLYLSIVLRPALDQKHWPLISLATAVAVADALHDAGKIKTDIKWPNDVMHNDKKLCGILAETVDTELGRACIVGIGVNLTDAAFPVTLAATATSVADAAGRVTNSEQVLNAILKSFAEYYEILQSPNGSADIVTAWSNRSSYALGKRVRVTESDRVFVGTTRGLESDGALRVETDSGEISVLYAGEVQSLRATSDLTSN